MSSESPWTGETVGGAAPPGTISKLLFQGIRNLLIQGSRKGREGGVLYPSVQGLFTPPSTVRVHVAVRLPVLHRHLPLKPYYTGEIGASTTRFTW